jgi:phosphohistidine phosphatase SixA
MAYKNRITISKAQEDQATYIAQQSPARRIKETVELIIRVFGTPKKTVNNKRIYIDKA